MIVATNLVKRYGKQLAVNSVSLSVEKGQIFGLLGPNAAGKTTTIRMLCGIITNDEGEIRINDREVSQAKQNLGYVAQHFGQYEELSVMENLFFYAKMYGVDDESRLMSLLERYALTEFKDRLAGELSGGFQRRLALACALAHDPEVIFLDEPTAGIDPITRKLLWDDFYHLSAQGKTLFVTTHYMEEAQRCHRLAFMAHGRIIAEGTPDSIRQALGEVNVYAIETPYNPELHAGLEQSKDVLLVNQFGSELRCVTSSQLTSQQLEEITQAHTGLATHFEETEANLEDVFIALNQMEEDQS